MWQSSGHLDGPAKSVVTVLGADDKPSLQYHVYTDQRGARGRISESRKIVRMHLFYAQTRFLGTQVPIEEL